MLTKASRGRLHEDAACELGLSRAIWCRSVAFVQQCVSTSTFFPSLVNTKTLVPLHCVTNMAPDLMTERFDKGYIKARALYHDDRLGEAIEAAEQLLKDPGITRASTRGTSLIDSR